MQGHDRACSVCGELCSSLAGNPARWPSLVEHDTYAHIGCIREVFGALRKIAASPDEDNEWHGRDLYREVRDLARKAMRNDARGSSSDSRGDA